MNTPILGQIRKGTIQNGINLGVTVDLRISKESASGENVESMLAVQDGIWEKVNFYLVIQGMGSQITLGQYSIVSSGTVKAVQPYLKVGGVMV